MPDGQMFTAPADGGGWVDLGYTTDDGLTYPADDTGAVILGIDSSRISSTVVAVRDHGGYVTVEEIRDEEQRTAEAEHSRRDILAAIDAAVEQLCACGCGTALRPDGPSAYFASQGCQNRWNNAQATDPHQVYARPDAADVYTDHDRHEVPLREQPHEMVHPAIGVASSPEQRRRYWSSRALLPPCEDPHGVAYRRGCPHCGQRVIPRVIDDDPADIRALGAIEPVRMTRYRHICPSCYEELPDPVYLARVYDEGRRLVLVLHDDRARVQRIILIRRIQCTDRRLVERTWADMERQLSQFRTAWLGPRAISAGGHDAHPLGG